MCVFMLILHCTDNANTATVFSSTVNLLIVVLQRDG